MPEMIVTYCQFLSLNTYVATNAYKSTGGGSYWKLGGPLIKFQDFSIAKIKFLWKALKFKKGYGSPAPLFSTAHVQKIQMYTYF